MNKIGDTDEVGTSSLVLETLRKFEHATFQRRQTSRSRVKELDTLSVSTAFLSPTANLFDHRLPEPRPELLTDNSGDLDLCQLTIETR